jgi:amidase
MNQKNYHYLGLHEISTLIRTGEVTSVEVTEQQLARIKETDNLNAYIEVTADTALQQAREADAETSRGKIRGPLHGVPIALKDIYDMAGVATTAAMAIRQNAIADIDSTVVRKLKDAGAVILGKLNMAECVFAEHLEPYGAPLNPWGHDLYPGASSSGSGVAAAAGLCYAAVSSDTGGSIRIPTSVNGVTGLKPTWGRVSRQGVFELAATLDHVGVIARTAVDAGLILGAMAGHDPQDPTSSLLPVPDYTANLDGDLSKIKIGVDRQWVSDNVDDATVATLMASLDTLASLGATIIDVEFPDPTQIVDDWYDVCAVQTAFAHRDTYPSQKDQYGPAISAALDHGRSMTGMDYQEVLLRREDFTGKVQAVFSSVDLIACPGLAFPIPTLKRMTNIDDEIISGLHRFTCPFTMSRNPTITMVGGYTDNDLPIAVQLVAPHFQEELLIKAGHGFQQVTNWQNKHPID